MIEILFVHVYLLLKPGHCHKRYPVQNLSFLVNVECPENLEPFSVEHVELSKGSATFYL